MSPIVELGFDILLDTYVGNLYETEISSGLNIMQPKKDVSKISTDTMKFNNPKFNFQADSSTDFTKEGLQSSSNILNYENSPDLNILIDSSLKYIKNIKDLNCRIKNSNPNTHIKNSTENKANSEKTNKKLISIVTPENRSKTQGTPEKIKKRMPYYDKSFKLIKIHTEKIYKKNDTKFHSGKKIFAYGEHEFNIKYIQFKQLDKFSGSDKDSFKYQIFKDKENLKKCEVYKNFSGPDLNYLFYMKNFLCKKKDYYMNLLEENDDFFLIMKDLLKEIKKFFESKISMTDLEIIEYLLGTTEESFIFKTPTKRNNPEILFSFNLQIMEVFTELQEDRTFRFILPEYLAFEKSKNQDFFKNQMNRETETYVGFSFFFLKKLNIMLEYLHIIHIEDKNMISIQRFLTFRFLFRHLILKNTENIWKHSFFTIYSNINLLELKTNAFYKFDLLYLENKEFFYSLDYITGTRSRYNIHSVIMRLLFLNNLQNMLPKDLYLYEHHNNISDISDIDIKIRNIQTKIPNYHFYKVYLERAFAPRYFFNYITRNNYQTILFLNSIKTYYKLLQSNPLYSDLVDSSYENDKLLRSNEQIKTEVPKTKKVHKEMCFKKEVSFVINFLRSLYAHEYMNIPHHKNIEKDQ